MSFKKFFLKKQVSGLGQPNPAKTRPGPRIPGPGRDRVQFGKFPGSGFKIARSLNGPGQITPGSNFPGRETRPGAHPWMEHISIETNVLNK